MTYKIIPLFLDQQAFARKRQRVVVEAGGINRGRLDQPVAAYERRSRSTGEHRSRPFTRSQRLVSGELQVQREPICIEGCAASAGK
jgi:hypothetical protein